MLTDTYLWKIIDYMKKPEVTSPEMAQGMVREEIGDEVIINNLTGEEISERSALSVYGRNMKELLSAYNSGDKKEFAQIVYGQQFDDNEWQKKKEEEQKA